MQTIIFGTHTTFIATNAVISNITVFPEQRLLFEKEGNNNITLIVYCMISFHSKFYQIVISLFLPKFRIFNI